MTVWLTDCAEQEGGKVNKKKKKRGEKVVLPYGTGTVYFMTKSWWAEDKAEGENLISS